MSEGELSKYLFKTANSGYKYMKKREFVFPAIAQFGIGFVACLPKAEKIKILTCARGQSSIGAEIEAQSTVAFIEKNIERDYPGTTIMIQVKEKYSFSELKEYISKYFHYPSVEIDLVDTDILQKYTTEENLFNISSGFLRRMLVIDECSTVSNSDMRKVLEKRAASKIFVSSFHVFIAGIKGSNHGCQCTK